MPSRKGGRPKGRPLNHHLFLHNGMWIFRLCKVGKDHVRPTGCPAAEAAAARKIRDKWLGEYAARRAGVEELPAAKTLDAVIKAYLAAESQPYDRERGGVQPGCKRSSRGDLSVVEQVKRHFDFSLPVDRIDRERLFDAAAAMAKEGLAPNTIRNRFRFLARVFNWAKSNKRKTGLTANIFNDLDRVERKPLFCGTVAKKAPPYSREQLRGIYELLPAHVYRPVRFAAHSGMRFGELLRMVWGRVDFDRRVYVTDPRWTKMNKEREVPLGDVALGILKALRPPDALPDDPVWINSRERPLRDLDSVLKRVMKKKELKPLFPDPRPGWRLPDRHSFRRTCASAVAQVAPLAVISAILGHSPQSVTDLYVSIPLEDQVAALNRAALLIDGDPANNVVPIARPRADARDRQARA